MSFSLVLCALLSTPAQAADYIQAWSYDSFQDGSSMVDRDGWITGYHPDEWRGYRSDSGTHWVYPTTDDPGRNYDGIWGDGGAHDNWFVNSEHSFGDARMGSTIYSEDDDGLGLVLCHDGDSYYLFFMTGYRNSQGSSYGSYGSHPFGEDEDFFSAIVKVSGSSATILAHTDESYLRRTSQALRFEHDDGRLVAQLWAGSTTSGSPYLELTATDDNPLAPGNVGYYGWNTGGADGDFALFGGVTVHDVDEDEDGTADDDDNCEELANPNQTDTDGDGIGDACDDNPTDPDDPDDTGGPDDPDDTGEPDDAIPDTGLPAVGGGMICGCSGSTAPAGALLGLLGLLCVARRRG